MGNVFFKYVVSVFIVGLAASSAWATPTLEEQVQELVRQNEEQAQLIQQLQERMAELAVSSQEPHRDLVESTVESGSPSLVQAINNHVQLSGVVEVEGSSADDFDGNDSSDINLATVEIGLDAQLSDWSAAHLLVLYEEGEEDDHLIIDEGFITLGNLDSMPLYLTAGKMYVPFGHFESNMVSDPLTLEMAETGDSGVLLGFEASGFHGSVYGFNGDIDEIGEHGDYIDNFGLNGGFVFAKDNLTLDLGLAYISNIGDTDGIGDFLDGNGITAIKDYVDGVATHAVLGMGPLVMVAEYVTALDDFDLVEVAYRGSGAEPKAYQFEVAYTTVFRQRVTTLALGYQGTDEAVAFGLPESRYLGTLSMELFACTALAVEYFHAEDYVIDDGGTGQDADSFTLQLALEF